MARKNGKVGGVHETTIVMTPKTTLEELAKAKRDTKKRVQSMNGTLGEKIAAAAENKHLDKKAFSMACALDALDDERLHLTYHNLLYYMEAMGIEQRATAQEELFVNGGGEDDEEDGEKSPKGDGKVTSIGRAARKVAEAAGTTDDKTTH